MADLPTVHSGGVTLGNVCAQPTEHCIIVTFNSAAGYDKNKKGIEHKDAKS